MKVVSSSATVPTKLSGGSSSTANSYVSVPSSGGNSQTISFLHVALSQATSTVTVRAIMNIVSDRIKKFFFDMNFSSNLCSLLL